MGEEEPAQPASSASTSELQYKYEQVITARDTAVASGIDYGEAAPIPCNDGAGRLWDVWAREPGADWYLADTQCVSESDEAAEPELPALTPGRIQRAFERIDLPESRLVVQPPGGQTLVNFDTLFSTAAEPFSESIQLLGRQVDFEIEPSQFRFHHGDGSSQTTDWPGRTFDETVPVAEGDYIVHRYPQAPATVQARVDTTWSARFRVDGGPWRPVPGTVTMTGESVPLEVREASPTLVAGD